MKLIKSFVLVAAAATLSLAQNPLSVGQKVFYGVVAHNVLAAAEKMPEENYSFKPTPEVRSFGQLIGHAADAQFMFCSAVSSEKPTMMDVEKTKTSKADLVQALRMALPTAIKPMAR